MNASTLYQFRQGKRLGPATEQDIKQSEPLILTNSTIGNRTGMLLLHGFTSTPMSLYNIAMQLSDQLYHVHAPRLPGHGTSINDLANTTSQDWINAAHGHYFDMRKHCDKVIVVGQSLGGALAVLLAQQFADIDALVLLVPALSPPKLLQLSRYFIPLLKASNIHHLHAIGGDIKNKKNYELNYKKTPIRIYTQLLKTIKLAQQALPDITTNTTVIASRQDHVLLASGMKKAYERIGSPQKELIWLENSYHVVSLDNDADTIIDILKSQF